MKNTLLILAMLSSPQLVLAQSDYSAAIRIAPPPVRAEPLPPPRSGYLWVPGYWNWEGRRHAWIAGHWEIARPGYHYRPSEWVYRDGMWRLHHGSWARHDRDHDGIPDRHDRHPNNPYRG
jgi:hypothetical protein